MTASSCRYVIAICLLAILGSVEVAASSPVPLDRLRLPPGFEIEIFAEVPTAREMVVADGGRLVFVSSRSDTIVAAVDTDGDRVADQLGSVLGGLHVPHGLALDAETQDLYIVEQDKIRVVSGWRRDDGVPFRAEVIFDGLPDLGWHGWRSAAFGPDGKLYIAVGAPCNICRLSGLRGTIVRVNKDGSDLEVFARGVRNSVGFDWHPQSGELYFTDNGGDDMGDLIPPDELNHAPSAGLHFGFPFVWGSEGKAYPGFEGAEAPGPMVAPVVEWDAHAAALGVHFYDGAMFPADYKNAALVALHGSWNRDPEDPAGYKVMRVRFDDTGKPASVEPFIEGFLNDDKSAWGRPVHFAQLPDGSLLLSDDFAGLIYRISYRR